MQVTESPTCGECRYCVDTGVDISRYLHTHLTRARTGHWSPGMWALGGEVVRVRGGLLRDIAFVGPGYNTRYETVLSFVMYVSSGITGH